MTAVAAVEAVVTYEARMAGRWRRQVVPRILALTALQIAATAFAPVMKE